MNIVRRVQLFVIATLTACGLGAAVFATPIASHFAAATNSSHVRQLACDGTLSPPCN